MNRGNAIPVIPANAGISSRVRIVLCAALLLCSVLPVQADIADEIVVRTTVSPQGTLYIGQPVSLEVEILTPTWFTRGTRPQLFTLDDTVVVSQADFATNSTVRVLGKTHASQLWSRLFFPQRAGDYQIPAQRFDIQVADGEGGNRTLEVHSEPMPISVQAPPPAPAATVWFSASEVSLSQTFERSSELLLPGEFVRRTVSLTASATTTGMLPKLNFNAPPGIAVYASLVEQHNSQQRGEWVAELRWQVDYMLEQPGRYQLDDVALQWWNPYLQSWQQEVVHGEPVEVLKPVEPWRWAAITLMVLVIIAAAGRLLLRWWQAPDRQLQRKIIRRLQRGRLKKAYCLLGQWLARQYPGQTLRQFAGQRGDAQLVELVEKMLGHLSRAEEVEMPELARALQPCLQASRSTRKGAQLAPLNP